ncbi:YitT family protein [Culicoidibacter larvae]|uniref:YitT family protein n=1 Tax=Culicoidibacter larvae TaxID=2579976 RepID=A0A5R8QI25_9FIRM|nr:YitT family protein [Culicoidibacter larvae]TLG77454.1 YitT family protein [Culicoidibacter larvae]
MDFIAKMKQFDKRTFFEGLVAVIVGSCIYVAGFKLFAIPAGVYSGGITGLSQILEGYLASNFGISLSLGMLTILANIPLLIFGWLKVSRSFVILSIVSVVTTGVLLSVVPTYSIADEIWIDVLFGGLLIGAGTGISLRYGGSTGGIDIISMYASLRRGGAFGNYSLYINAGVILLAGLVNNLEVALYTLIMIYVSTQVVNTIHTQHRKLTAFIVTANPEPILHQLHVRCKRGGTVIDAQGSFSGQERKMIMTVVSSYQLHILREIVSVYDEHAFVNIVPTRDIYGNFASIFGRQK